MGSSLGNKCTDFFGGGIKLTSSFFPWKICTCRVRGESNLTNHYSIKGSVVIAICWQGWKPNRESNKWTNAEQEWKKTHSENIKSCLIHSSFKYTELFSWMQFSTCLFQWCCIVLSWIQSTVQTRRSQFINPVQECIHILGKCAESDSFAGQIKITWLCFADSISIFILAARIKTNLLLVEIITRHPLLTNGCAAL